MEPFSKGTLLDERVLQDLGYNITPPPSTPISLRQKRHQIMNSPIDPKSEVRKAFADVYNGVIMTKTNQWEKEPYGTYGVYKARLNSYTSSDGNIIIAIVEDDVNPIGTNKLIDSLPWVSFQTREMTNSKKDLNGFTNIPYQNYMIKNDCILHDKIKLKSETPTKCIYRAENLPLKVELLKLRDDSQFSREGTIWSALEVFSTLVSFE
jgi:hypothetical protein